MAQRYATLVTNSAGEDEVSAISVMEGSPPEVRSSDNARVIKVADGVKIGMIKGGPVDSVSGYGFRAGTSGKLAEPAAEQKTAKREKTA